MLCQSYWKVVHVLRIKKYAIQKWEKKELMVYDIAAGPTFPLGQLQCNSNQQYEPSGCQWAGEMDMLALPLYLSSVMDV